MITAEYFRRLVAQRGLDVRTNSAGLNPDLAVPPKVLQGLMGDGIDVRESRPRRLTREALAGASLVISFACDLGDLAPPSVTVEGWDDIPEVHVDFQAARNLIIARLAALLAEFEALPRPPTAYPGWI